MAGAIGNLRPHRSTTRYAPCQYIHKIKIRKIRLKEKTKVKVEKLPSMVPIKGQRSRRPKKYFKKGKDEKDKECHHIIFNKKS